MSSIELKVTKSQSYDNWINKAKELFVDSAGDIFTVIDFMLNSIRVEYRLYKSCSMMII